VFESAKRPSSLGLLFAVVCLQVVPLLAWVVPIDVRTPSQPTPDCVAVTAPESAHR